MSVSKKSSWLVLSTIFGLLILISCVVFLMPIAPGGKFDNKWIANIGPSFFEFKDGRVTLVMSRGSTLKDGVDVKDLGVYTNQNGKWVIIAPDGDTIPVRTTILGIEIFQDETHVGKYPRLFREPK